MNTLSSARRQLKTSARPRFRDTRFSMPIKERATQPAPAPKSMQTPAPPQIRAYLGQILHAFAAAWRWVLAKRVTQQRSKRLRVVETVSLGEKRFAAVLSVDGSQFLIGGGANGVSLLAALGTAREPLPFPEVLRQQEEHGH